MRASTSRTADPCSLEANAAPPCAAIARSRTSSLPIAFLRYAREMEEIAPGLWHWSARHERIGLDVSSYYLRAERVLIDPMLPPGDGLKWLEQNGPPAHVLMSNRHHDRDAWRLRERFGCVVH